nr:serine/threonine-protein kinase [Kofleriaceae bacterium]
MLAAMAPEGGGNAGGTAEPKVLKKYTLLGRLATGGMAELFLARANGLGGFERLLVIKKILPAHEHDAQFVRMLLDEARISATLQHSNIVQVFDIDMDDGAVFFVMEHLHGQHVGELLARAAAARMRVSLENAIAIAVAVAAGLHYAHERWGADGKPLEIVHRDVAPNNVVVTYDGNVKLIDFGIAKASGRLSETRFGIFKGKLPYASPEQCRCEPVDRRTDVYSLGALLYELTTGHRAFEATNEYELLRLMTEAMVTTPRMHDKAYPRELERIVLKAMSKEPGDRYQTAQAMQRDLEVFAAQARLDLSAFSLSRLMEQLFEVELANWQDSRRAGLRLEEHISRGMTAVMPAPELAAGSIDGEDEREAAPPVTASSVTAPVTVYNAPTIQAPVVQPPSQSFEPESTLVTHPHGAQNALLAGAACAVVLLVCLFVTLRLRTHDAPPVAAAPPPAVVQPVASMSPLAEPAPATDPAAVVPATVPATGPATATATAAPAATAPVKPHPAAAAPTRHVLHPRVVPPSHAASAPAPAAAHGAVDDLLPPSAR